MAIVNSFLYVYKRVSVNVDQNIDHPDQMIRKPYHLNIQRYIDIQIWHDLAE